MSQNPKLPEGTWSINAEDKKEIVAFGRELSKFIYGYVKSKGVTRFHTKLVAGAFQYFMDLQTQKAKIVGDDILIAQDTLEKNGLGAEVNEPFDDPEPVVETKEQKIARLKADLEELEKPEPVADPEVEEASITPDNKPVQVDAPAQPETV